eukprot:scaffold1.g5578.t1
MSSTVPYYMLRDPALLDIIDEEWARDTLPDDDVPLPTVAQPTVDEAEDPGAEAKPKQPEKWLELGLNTVH